MQCFVYKSLRKDELYIYLGKKDDFSMLPEALKSSLGPTRFIMELELTPQRKLARESAIKVIESLNTKGFFIQLPPISALPASGTPGRPLH